MKLNQQVMHSAILLMLTVSEAQLETDPCPAPFQRNYTSQLCLFIDPSQNFTWCSANHRCAELGGELVNSPESINVLASINMLAAGYTRDMWVGLTDLASEVRTNRTGWQRINGGGMFPTIDSLWYTDEPSGNSGEDCARIVALGHPRLADRLCNNLIGLICQYVRPPTPSFATVGEFWKRVGFNRTRSITYFCSDDYEEAVSEQQCLIRASLCGSSCRSALYNSKLGACRLLRFTDAPVDQSIESSPDWVKLGRKP